MVMELHFVGIRRLVSNHLDERRHQEVIDSLQFVYLAHLVVAHLALKKLYLQEDFLNTAMVDGQDFFSGLPFQALASFVQNQKLFCMYSHLNYSWSLSPKFGK